MFFLIPSNSNLSNLRIKKFDSIECLVIMHKYKSSNKNYIVNSKHFVMELVLPKSQAFSNQIIIKKKIFVPVRSRLCYAKPANFMEKETQGHSTTSINVSRISNLPLSYIIYINTIVYYP